MTTGTDVLNMLCPEGGWIIYGDDFDNIGSSGLETRIAIIINNIKFYHQ